MQNELNHKEDAAKIEIVDVTHSKKNTFVLTQEERAEIEQEKHHYEDPRAASIEALKIVQKIEVGLKTVLSMLLPMCLVYRLAM